MQNRTAKFVAETPTLEEQAVLSNTIAGSVPCSPENAMPILHQLVKTEQLEQIEKHLKLKQEDIKEKDCYGKTALHVAACTSLQVFQLLLQYNPNFSDVDNKGNSVLHYVQ